MRILVMGAGALGSVFGGLLADKRHEVSLVGREDHMRAVRERGLRVSGLFGEALVRDIKTAANPAEYAGVHFDVALVTVKAYDTASAADEIKDIIDSDTIVISLQNGLGNYEILSKIFGPERVLAGRVIFGARIPAPGEVEVTVYAEPVMIGSPSNEVAYDRIESIASVFASADIPTEATREITKYVWAKILYNCALNPLSAVLQSPYGGLLTHDCSKAIMRRVVEEIFTVASAESIELFWDKPEDYIDVLFGRLIPDTAAHCSSMLQDISAGKRTEISALNGEIVRRSRIHGVDTPINEMLVCLVDTRESWIRRPEKTPTLDE
jgi:2-dehydropantoate 2-reductase